jgi:hypothetical protein
VFNTTGWPANSSAIIRSPDGRIFVAGADISGVDLGSGPIPRDPAYGIEATNVFLARIDPGTQKAVWATSFPGFQTQTVTSLAANGAGHLGLIGSLKGSMIVGGEELDALYGGDQFIVAASADDGSGLWAKRLNLSGGSGKGLTAIVGDPQGDSFMVCGSVACGQGALKPDAGPDPNPAKDLSPNLACHGGTDLVVARIAIGSVDGGIGGGGGEVVWADQVGGVNDESCSGLAMDAASNVFVVGTYTFGSSVVFGSLPPLPIMDHANGATWMFVAKLVPNANDSSRRGYDWAWARSVGSGGDVFTPQVITTLDGDVVIAGLANAAATFQHGVALAGSSSSAQSSFIARFDGGTGDLSWVQALGSGTVPIVKSLAEQSGHLVVAGNYGPVCSACELGAIPLPQPGGGAAFLAHVDPSATGKGAVVAARGYGIPQHTNTAFGAVPLDASGGDGLDGGLLLLLSFSSYVDLGKPLGVVHVIPPDGGSAVLTTNQSCLARIGP